MLLIEQQGNKPLINLKKACFFSNPSYTPPNPCQRLAWMWNARPAKEPIGASSVSTSRSLCVVSPRPMSKYASGACVWSTECSASDEPIRPHRLIMFSALSVLGMQSRSARHRWSRAGSGAETSRVEGVMSGSKNVHMTCHCRQTNTQRGIKYCRGVSRLFSSFFESPWLALIDDLLCWNPWEKWPTEVPRKHTLPRQRCG